MRKIFGLSILLILTLVVVPTAFAAEGDEVKVEGVVTEVTADDFTVEDGNGTLHTFLLPDDPDFTISIDDEVEVKGVENVDGDIAPTKIENETTGDDFKAGEDDDGDGGEVGNVLEHPVVTRIADGLDDFTYDDIWTIFRDGTEENPGTVGLGRIMTAIRLFDALGDDNGEFTSWVDLLNWHLEGSGWGAIMVATKQADRLGIDASTLIELREDHKWGDINQAARLSDLCDDCTFGNLLAARANGSNWGEIRKELGLSGPKNGNGHGHGRPDNPGNGNGNS